MSKDKVDNMSFEEAMNRLDVVVRLLENPQTTLEQSLELYSESAKLVSFCTNLLENAKLKVEEIYPNSDFSVEVNDD